jgi:hypothetical protein
VRGCTLSAPARPLILVGLVLAGQAAAAGAQTLPTLPRAEVTLSPRRVTVGDRVEAVLTVTVPAGAAAPRFPTWRSARGPESGNGGLGSWGPAEVLDAGTPERESGPDGTEVYRQRLVLAAFAPGRAALPPVEVAVPLAERTVQVRTPADLAFEVASVLPAGTDELAPKPPAPLRRLPLGKAFWWTAAGLSAACLGAWLLLWRRARQTAGGGRTAAPTLPPLAELLARLDRIAVDGPAVAAHTALSAALRGYLGRTLGFRAAESTTSEIQRIVSRRVPGGLARRAVDLLRACDLVKFARQEAGPESSRERVAAARRIAEEVEDHLRPPALPSHPPPTASTTRRTAR